MRTRAAKGGRREARPTFPAQPAAAAVAARAPIECPARATALAPRDDAAYAAALLNAAAREASGPRAVKARIGKPAPLKAAEQKKGSDPHWGIAAQRRASGGR